MPSDLRIKIKKCIRVRKGYKDQFRCGSDWCNCCSRARTDWFLQEVKEFVSDSPKQYFTTILLKPRRTVDEILQDADRALVTLLATGIEATGVLEISSDTDISDFGNIVDFIPALHKGFGHFHIVSPQPIRPSILPFFPLKRQVLEKELYNLDDLVDYFRKRHSCNYWWIDEVKDDQLLFKLCGGKVEKAVGMVWDGGQSQCEEIVGDARNSECIVTVCMPKIDDQMVKDFGNRLSKQAIDQHVCSQRPPDNPLFLMPEIKEKKKQKRVSPWLTICGVNVLREQNDVIRKGKFKDRTFKQMFKHTEWPAYKDYLYKHKAYIHDL